MSYNPAFVAEESPLAHTGNGDSACQSNGIKLTSFKPLPSSVADKTDQEKARQSKQQNGHAKRQIGAGTDKKPAATTAKKHQKSSSQSFLVSGSSTLSLIDNPTLSSLATAATNTTASGSLTPNNCSPSEASSAASYSPSTTSSNVSSLAHGPNSLGLSAAVECRDMRYAVGRGKNEKTILHDINVTVPEGSIYGLLGPSGCGKTTMLRCVVGRIKPRSGYVRVFGYKPNDSGSQIPGPAIGYMPQEISVYEDFTINETLTYFGKINKMKQDLIDARIHFLLNFLDLPGKNRLIASLR